VEQRELLIEETPAFLRKRYDDTVKDSFDEWLIFQTIVDHTTRRGVPCVSGGQIAPLKHLSL